MKIDTSKLKSSVKISPEIVATFQTLEARHRALHQALEEAVASVHKAHADQLTVLSDDTRKAWQEAVTGTDLDMNDGLSIDLDQGYIAKADELEAAIACGLNAEGIDVRKLAEQVMAVEPVQVQGITVAELPH